MFNHLGHAGAKLRQGQGSQQVGVDDHQFRLFERADQVFALRQINADLAAHAGIHHRQEGSGDLHKGQAAQKGGGGKTGGIAHHPAAQGDDRAVAVQFGVDELFVQAGHGFQRFMLLTLGHIDAGGLKTGLAQAVQQRLGVKRADGLVGDHGAAAFKAEFGQAHAGFGQDALAQVKGVAAGGMGDGDCLHGFFPGLVRVSYWVTD
jgi:hypothetical protein